MPRLSRKAEKQLRANFQQLSLIQGNLIEIDRKLKTLYFTSCFPKEGKTTAAVNTAFGLSVYGGRNVLLLDSNYESPQVHRLFGVSHEIGLQDILNNSVPAEEAILPTGYEKLYLLPAGSGHLSLYSKTFQGILRYFKENFDFVLIDGKSLFTLSEVANIAPSVDGFLLVVECEKTKWEVVQLAQEKLTRAGARNTAIILNKRKFYLPKSIYRFISKR